MKKYIGESDPRHFIIEERIRNINRVVVVMSPKGGVGKTIFSTITTLVLTNRSYKTGLLDLDLTNPSTHIVLGINPLDYKPLEEKGLTPSRIHGIEYFTIAMYTGDKPLPLRGKSVTNVFLEVLTIVKWSPLDFLVIDTPPSIRDEHLNILTYIGSRSEAVLITTPSIVAVKSISKLIDLLRESGFKITGLVENMSSGELLKQFCIENNVDYLGYIPYEPLFDNKLGNVDKLRESIVWKSIENIIEKL